MTSTNKTHFSQPLQPRDIIGLAAPAGPVKQDILNQGVKLLQGAKLVPTFNDDVLSRDGYLAGSDQRRRDELHKLFANPNVKAILAIRGGFGSSRLLDQLDFDLIRQNPKIIIGFSDLTILLNAITAKTGLTTWHGPMLSTLVRDGLPPLHDLLNTLSQPQQPELKVTGLEILRPGHVQGHLLGGNLTSLIHLLATPYEPRWQGGVLFFEDINEPAYRIDRMLTQLHMSGRLQQVAGVIVGELLDNSMQNLSEIELIWNRILDLTDEHIPIWANFPSGHGPRNVTLPLGGIAKMDSSRGVLEFPKANLGS